MAKIKLQIPQIEKILKALNKKASDKENKKLASDFYTCLNEKQYDVSQEQLNIYKDLYDFQKYVESEEYNKVAKKCLVDIWGEITKNDAKNHSETQLTSGNIVSLVSNAYADTLVQYDRRKTLFKEVFKANKLGKIKDKKGKAYEPRELAKKINEIYEFDKELKEIQLAEKQGKTYVVKDSKILEAENMDIYNKIKDDYNKAVKQKNSSANYIKESIDMLYFSMGENFTPNLFGKESSPVFKYEFSNDMNALNDKEVLKDTLKELQNVNNLMKSCGFKTVMTTSDRNFINGNQINFISTGNVYDDEQVDVVVRQHNEYLNRILNVLYVYNEDLFEQAIPDSKYFKKEMIDYASGNVKNKNTILPLTMFNEDDLKTALVDETNYESKYNDVKQLSCLLTTLKMFECINVGSDYLAVEKVMTDLISNKILSIKLQNKLEYQINMTLVSALRKYDNGDLPKDRCLSVIERLKEKYETAMKDKDNTLELSKNIDSAISYLKNPIKMGMAEQCLKNEVGCTQNVLGDLTFLYSVDKFNDMYKDFSMHLSRLLNEKAILAPVKVNLPTEKIDFKKGKNIDMFLQYLDDVRRNSGVTPYGAFVNLNDLALNPERSENQYLLQKEVVYKDNNVVSANHIKDIVDVTDINQNVADNIEEIIKKNMNGLNENSLNNYIKNFKDVKSNLTANILTDNQKQQNILNNLSNEHACLKMEEIGNIQNMFSAINHSLKRRSELAVEQVDFENNIVALKNPLIAAKSSIGKSIASNLTNIVNNKMFEGQLMKYTKCTEEDYPRINAILVRICGIINNKTEVVDFQMADKYYKKVVNAFAGSEGLNNSIQRSIVNAILARDNGMDFIMSESVTSSTSNNYYTIKKEELKKQYKKATKEEKAEIIGQIKELDKKTYRYDKLKDKVNQVIRDFANEKLNLNVTTSNAIESLESYVLTNVIAQNIYEARDLTYKAQSKIAIQAINELKSMFSEYCLNNENIKVSEDEIDRNLLEKLSKRTVSKDKKTGKEVAESGETIVAD